MNYEPRSRNRELLAAAKERAKRRPKNRLSSFAGPPRHGNPILSKFRKQQSY